MSATATSGQQSLLRSLLSILALSAAGGTIYLIPYLRYTFYDAQQQTMGISHTEIALLTTAYAIGCLLVYIPGGILSDRTRARTNIILSLLATTVLTVIYAFTPGSYGLSLAIWFAFALSTAFVFWGSLFKALRLIGTSKNQGLLFGIYYAGNGLTGAAVNGISLAVTSDASSPQQQFVTVVLIYAASTALAAVMVFLLVPRTLADGSASTNARFVRTEVVGLLRSKSLWLFAVVMFASYSVYSSLSYFTPYFTEVLGVTPNDAGLLTTLRYALYVFAPLSGLIADRVFRSTSKWFIVLFSTLAVLFVGVILIPADTSVGVITLYSFLPALVGIALYGVQFSIAAEARIPPAVMATAIGIASMVGYLPDFFLPLTFGSFIDNLGSNGYVFIFLVLAGLSLIGAICSFAIRRRHVTASARPDGATAKEPTLSIEGEK
jgi:nitrate/nitrite transporter NarK